MSDSDDMSRAARLIVQPCGGACSCNLVHLVLLDKSGDCLAAASLDPDQARLVADDMSAMADMMEARHLRGAGRLQ